MLVHLYETTVKALFYFLHEIGVPNRDLSFVTIDTQNQDLQ